MDLLLYVGMLILDYLIGSIPFGFIIVRLRTGKDIRNVESGRTGGTNAMRAAGLWAGIVTAILDFIKGSGAVWLAKTLFPLANHPGNAWMHVLAPILVILGHNYSIFLIERNQKGELRLRGGAGGAPCVGGAFGLWAPSSFVILPLAAAIFYFIGYASVTTMSVALITAGLFAVLGGIGMNPWQYALYGILAEFLIVWSLRSNIKRLIAGNERLVGWRARRFKKAPEN
jgi:glycerol-3-phosphate acyltransferase PlsY